MKRTPVKRRRSGTRRGPANIPASQWRAPKYLQFLRDFGRCMVCGAIFCDPAHGKTNGMSSKGPDADAGPLCRNHHTVQHEIGWEQFEVDYAVDREKCAKYWWGLFKARPKTFKGEV